MTPIIGQAHLKLCSQRYFPSSRTSPIESHILVNKVRYKGRNVIERMFGRLKDFRRVATRYDKNAENLLSALCLAALICYWI